MTGNSMFNDFYFLMVFTFYAVRRDGKMENITGIDNQYMNRPGLPARASIDNYNIYI